MLKITIICVGNLKDAEYIGLCNEYIKRLKRFAHINIVELKEKNNLKNVNCIIEAESQDILQKMNNSILLDVNGEKISSEALANIIESTTQNSSEISFVIGGSYGVSQSVKNASVKKISLSDMTFPHRLVRVMLLEQIYRAFTINNNIAYHK